MSETLKSAVSDVVTEEESALFVATVTVSPLDYLDFAKGAKIDRRVRFEGVLMSKQAMKNILKARAEAEQVTVPVTTEVKAEFTAHYVEEDLFPNMLESLFGEDFPKLQAEMDARKQMDNLRAEAGALMNRAKAVSARINTAESALREQIFRLKMKTYWKAEGWMNADYFKKFGSLKEWDVISARLEYDRKAWRQVIKDEQAKTRRQGLLDEYILRSKKNVLLDELNANNMKANEMEASAHEALDYDKAEQEKFFLEAQGKFNEANEIATVYGWPTTSHKNKENK